MRLEERLNKLLKDIGFEDISSLGELIVEIDESDIREWAKINGSNAPNMFVHYKYNCLRCKVRKLAQEFFRVNKKFNRQDLQKIFEMNSLFESKRLLMSLLEYGYILIGSIEILNKRIAFLKF